MRSRATLIGLAAGLWLLPALGADDDAPDMDFLLYLGSWEESDETWTLFDEAAETTAQADVDDTSGDTDTGDEDDES